MSYGLLDRRRLLAGLAATGLLPRRGHAMDAPWRWGVDYGPATDPVLARGYDLLVLEPSHARPIEPLRRPGARLLGYISLGEVEKGRAYAAELRQVGALKAPNPNWPDARMVDPRHPAWGTLVTDRLIPGILAKGYDGIFIDTVDTVEALERSDPAGHAGMVDATVALLARIRAGFPAITIMLNRGYAVLPRAAGSIDLLLGEAMSSRWNFETKQYEFTSPSDWEWQAARLTGAKAANPALRLTTLDYWNPADPATIAELYGRERRAGFYPYVATLALDRLHPEPQP